MPTGERHDTSAGCTHRCHCEFASEEVPTDPNPNHSAEDQSTPKVDPGVVRPRCIIV